MGEKVMIDYIEKLLIKIFSSKIKKIEQFEKYDEDGNAIDSIIIVHYSLFWFNVSEQFYKGNTINKDFLSFSLHTVWEKN